MMMMTMMMMNDSDHYLNGAMTTPTKLEVIVGQDGANQISSLLSDTDDHGASQFVLVPSRSLLLMNALDAAAAGGDRAQLHQDK